MMDGRGVARGDRIGAREPYLRVLSFWSTAVTICITQAACVQIEEMRADGRGSHRWCDKSVGSLGRIYENIVLRMVP